MVLTAGLTDAHGNNWAQHADEYYRIAPDARGNVLKKDSTRVPAPDFMQWEHGKGPFAATAKNLRDFLQSSMAWGVPMEELEYVAELLDHLGLYSIAKSGGGAMKQTADKNLEYGWRNLRTISELTHNTPGEALGREDCLVSYDKCPQDLADAYYSAFSRYIDTNRAFTGSNNPDDDRNTYKSTLAAGMKVQGEITYPVAKMPTEWWVDQALAKVEKGATTIGIKDGTGRMTPEEAKVVVSALRAALPENINIAMHCQSTVGIAANTYQAGIESGADSIHIVVGGWAAQRGAFPGLQSMLEVFRGSDHEAEYDAVRATVRGQEVNVMQEVDREMRRIIEKHPFLLGSNQAVEERAITSGAPGGGLAAYEVWLREQTPPADKLFDAVLGKQRETLAMMGWPASITPYYKIACDQALQNVASNPRYNDLKSGKVKWEDLSPEEQSAGNWKHFTPQFKKLLKGGYGTMPADENPELLTDEERELRESLQERALRESLQERALREDLSSAISSARKGAEFLKESIDNLLAASAEINQRYRDGNISEQDYVAFMKDGALSEEMLEIVSVYGEIGSIDASVLGGILKEGTYIACSAADILEPRVAEYADKVRDLIASGVHIGDIRKIEDIDRHPNQFAEAVVYAAMYNKNDEGLDLLKAFDVKQRLTSKGIVSGQLAEVAVEEGLVEKGEGAHTKLAAYDALKLGQALQRPVTSKKDVVTQLEGQLADAKGDKDTAKEAALKLIREELARAKQQAKIDTGSRSETEIKEIVTPFAEELGALRYEEKQLLAQLKGEKAKDKKAGRDPQGLTGTRDRIAELSQQQADIAAETRRTLREDHGFHPSAILGTEPIFNRVAVERIRELYQTQESQIAR